MCVYSLLHAHVESGMCSLQTCRYKGAGGAGRIVHPWRLMQVDTQQWPHLLQGCSGVGAQPHVRPFLSRFSERLLGHHQGTQVGVDVALP